METVDCLRLVRDAAKKANQNIHLKGTLKGEN